MKNSNSRPELFGVGGIVRSGRDCSEVEGIVRGGRIVWRIYHHGVDRDITAFLAAKKRIIKTDKTNQF